MTLVRPPEPDLSHLCVPPVVPDLANLATARVRATGTVVNGPVVPHAERFARDVAEKFGVGWISTYNGHDPDRTHALDLFAPLDVMYEIGEYAVEHMDAYGLWYVIRDQQIYNPGVADYWRDMADRGSPTANHKDHAHSSFLAVGPPDEEDEMTPEERDTLKFCHDVLTKLVAGVHPSNDAYGGAEEINRIVKQVKDEGTGGGLTLADVRADLAKRLK